MKLLLTSFGIEQGLDDREPQLSVFYRMPPVSFRWIKDRFMPDYDLLLLCDGLVMDESSFRKLTEEPSYAYEHIADTFSVLRREGRIELVDFGAVLKANENLLGRMVDHDMQALDQWVIPLRESLTLWSHFSRKSMELVRDDLETRPHSFRNLPTRGMPSARHHALVNEVASIMHAARNEAGHIAIMVDEALSSSAKRKRREYREPLREVLKAYLRYVNANIILSNELQLGFHDWLDFTPFYGAKFLYVGKDADPVQERRRQVEKLFTISFPELAISSTPSLLRALEDERVADLRQLISDAVAGKVRFDEEFARSVLREVFRIEVSSRKRRNIAGYLTLPLGFIPWVGSIAEKAVGEVAGRAIDHKMQQEHRWFYMLSELYAAGEE